MDLIEFDAELERLVDEFVSRYKTSGGPPSFKDWSVNDETKVEFLAPLKKAEALCEEKMTTYKSLEPAEEAVLEHIQLKQYGIQTMIATVEGSKMPVVPTIFQRSEEHRRY